MIKMKTPSVMKDSGIEWIGEIPEHWEVRRCKNLTTFINGYSFKTEELQQDFIYPVIRIGDIKNGRIEFDNCLGVNSNSLINQYKIKKDDILIAMSGATVGKIGIMTEDLDAYINQRVGIIRLDYPQFLYYCLLTKDFIEYILMTETSSAQPNMSKRDLEEFKIPYPPIEEQRLIAVQLNQICGTLDNTRSDIENQIEILNEYKKSVITEVVTKGLDKNVELKDSRIDWIGEVPMHWNVSRIKYFCTIGSGTDPITESGDTPVYGSGSKSFKTCEEYKIGPTVLLGRKGTINIPQWVEGNYWNVDTAFDVKSKGDFSLKLFYYISICLDYNRYNMQTTVPSMAKGDYENMFIPIPPIEEQKEIADYLDSKCSEIDSIIEAKKQQLELLEEYKKSIIYEYVTGKREVSIESAGDSQNE